MKDYVIAAVVAILIGLAIVFVLLSAAYPGALAPEAVDKMAVVCKERSLEEPGEIVACLDEVTACIPEIAKDIANCALELRSAVDEQAIKDFEGYTTGDPELDTFLMAIIAAYTSDDMSYEENLHALFRYVRDNFGYRKKPMRSSDDMEDWVFVAAKEMIDEGAGNCYSFASLLYCLFRAYDFDEAKLCVGTFCKSPHGWVEANIDNADYIFDVETEYASMSRRRKPDRYVNCFYRTYSQLKQFSYVKEGEFAA